MTKILKTAVGGYATAKIVNCKTGEVTRQIGYKNLVVDSGLQALVANPTKQSEQGSNQVSNMMLLLHTCKLSDDTTPITNKTTSIGDVVAEQSTSLLNHKSLRDFTTQQGMNEDDKGKYLYSTNEWTFTHEQITKDVNKVGIYFASVSPKQSDVDSDELTSSEDVVKEEGLFAAIHLRDTAGEIASIRPFEGESLVITYESRWYLPKDDSVTQSVNMGVLGEMDITLRAVGIPTSLQDRTDLLQATISQLSTQILSKTSNLLTPVIQFSTQELKSADDTYQSGDFISGVHHSDITVTETNTKPELVESEEEDAEAKTTGNFSKTISVTISTRPKWEQGAKSAVLYTSRGIYYVGFSNPITKPSSVRRTITLNFTFVVGRVE